MKNPDHPKGHSPNGHGHCYADLCQCCAAPVSCACVLKPAPHTWGVANHVKISRSVPRICVNKPQGALLPAVILIRPQSSFRSSWCFLAQLVTACSYFGPSCATWPSLGYNLGDLGANMAQLDPNLTPSWGQVGPSWVQHGAKMDSQRVFV